MKASPLSTALLDCVGGGINDGVYDFYRYDTVIHRLIYGLLRFKDLPNTALEDGDSQSSLVRPTFLRHLLRVGEFLIRQSAHLKTRLQTLIPHSAAP